MVRGHGTSRSISAIGFDLDGTLVDTMHFAPRVYADTILRLGGPAITAEDVEAVWHMGPTATLLQHFLARPVTDADIETYFRAFDEAFAGTRAFSGIARMLEQLAALEVPTGIVTTATRRAAHVMLRTAGLLDAVPLVIAGDDGYPPKPDPAALRALADRLGVEPAALAYVGDSPIDLDLAEAAGALPVLAGWARLASPSAAGFLVAESPRHVVRLVDAREPPV